MNVEYTKRGHQVNIYCRELPDEFIYIEKDGSWTVYDFLSARGGHKGRILSVCRTLREAKQAAQAVLKSRLPRPSMQLTQ